MAVVIETTLGDITVDLYLQQRPVTCLNFLKLCKMKYYNFNLFHTIRSGFIAQTGDPTGEGSGGQSVFGLLEGPDKRFFSGEKRPKIRHTDAGLLSMVSTGDMMIGSQFFFTLAPDLDSLDGIHCVIGEVTEGQDILRKLNDVICDEGHRPYRDVRITHTVVLEDPFNDPQGLRAPSRSPSPSAERLKGGRIAPDEEIDETQGKSAAEIQEMIEDKEAKARATILEIVGDLPDADIAPPENVLFVCKLNPVTTDDDLEIIFSRFGKIVSCEVIRDKKSGDSLQYAFIEFGDKKSCEDAYFKMDNVLIDDRRIHVDFSQSVSKMKWLGKGRGVKYYNDDEAKEREKEERNVRYEKSKHSESKINDYKKHNNDRNNHGGHKRMNDRDKDVERQSDRHHRQDRDYNYKSADRSFRKRSRSQSNDRSFKKRSRSPSYLDKSKDYKNNYSTDNNGSRNSEKHVKEYKNSSRYDNERNRNNSSNHNVCKNDEKNSRDPKYQSNRYEKERKRDNSSERNISRNNERNLKENKHDSSRLENERARDRNISRHSEKNSSDYKHDSNKYYNEHEGGGSNARRSRSSPSRNRISEKSKDSKNSYDRNDNRSQRENESSKSKHKNEDSESIKNKKIKKESQSIEPRTPSPTEEKKRHKTHSKHSEKTGKSKRNAKKKRKPSTSSESSSETSSSSTESSSSSEEDRKKKRKKRKYSTSSSSSSESSSNSSSSSSTESSSSSSSSSDDGKKKKIRKSSNKKKKL